MIIKDNMPKKKARKYVIKGFPYTSHVYYTTVMILQRQLLWFHSAKLTFFSR